MAKEIPYFKFFVSEWILGRISDHSDKVQGAFIFAICHYWHKNCDCFASDFMRKIGKKRFILLQNLNFIEVKNDKVFIRFLDEQYYELADTHAKRVISGKAGGEASAQAKREAKLKHLDKDKEEDKDSNSLFAKEVLDFLNLTCGTTYTLKAKKNLVLIRARKNEGFGLDDFKKVITTKFKEWGSDQKFKQYLRPDTLFGTKFESYLNQSSVGARELTKEEIDRKKELDFINNL